VILQGKQIFRENFQLENNLDTYLKEKTFITDVSAGIDTYLKEKTFITDVSAGIYYILNITLCNNLWEKGPNNIGPNLIQLKFTDSPWARSHTFCVHILLTIAGQKIVKALKR
jgi:hypothetical protein